MNERELAALAAGLPSVVRARALSGYVGRGGQAARSADAARAVSQFYNDRCGVAVVQVLNSLVRQVESDAALLRVPQTQVDTTQAYTVFVKPAALRAPKLAPAARDVATSTSSTTRRSPAAAAAAPTQVYLAATGWRAGGRRTRRARTRRNYCRRR